MAAGGFNGSSVSAEVEMFEPEAGVWTKVESMAEAKSGMTTVLVDRQEKVDKEASSGVVHVQEGRAYERKYCQEES